jgi:hypothetical protein
VNWGGGGGGCEEVVFAGDESRCEGGSYELILYTVIQYLDTLKYF